MIEKIPFKITTKEIQYSEISLIRNEHNSKEEHLNHS